MSMSLNNAPSVSVNDLSPSPPHHAPEAARRDGLEVQAKFDPYSANVVDPNLALLSPEDPDDENPTANCPKGNWKSIKRFMIGRGTRCCFYGAHARREAGKRKCQYALALLSILFIVLVSAVSFTIANRASAIFLQQAESDSGQIDMTVTASGNPAVNYTACVYHIYLRIPSLSLDPSHV
jgi:hypothetical protein